MGVRSVASRAEFLPLDFPCRLEELIAGNAASISILAGPAGAVILPPTWQNLAAASEWAYLGGRYPLDAPTAARARRLGEQVLAALPGARGYLGIDLVLGTAPDGSEDAVIEINPRLTTSYIGLRARSRVNLAWAMLESLGGRPCEVPFDESPLRFTADGRFVE